jgi:hypothetical protein
MYIRILRLCAKCERIIAWQVRQHINEAGKSHTQNGQPLPIGTRKNTGGANLIEVLVLVQHILKEPQGYATNVVFGEFQAGRPCPHSSGRLAHRCQPHCMPWFVGGLRWASSPSRSVPMKAKLECGSANSNFANNRCKSYGRDSIAVSVTFCET